MELLKGLPIMAFASQAAWRAWLDAHHAEAPGLWLRIYKRDSATPTVTYVQALDDALCYGWIDSTKNAFDAESFLQRFTPRKSRSVWSQVNREHVARLEAAGLMQPAGAKLVDVAKANGQWEKAYEPASRMSVPEDLAEALATNPAASAFFEGLDKTNRYAFLYRIQNVKKAETRLKKIAWTIDMLARGEKIH